MQQLLNLYHSWCGIAPHHFDTLPQAGSNRQYFRLYDNKGNSVIGVINPNIPENNSFIYLARHFSKKGLNVPHIVAVSEDKTCYLQDDLGNLSLYEALAKSRKNNYSDKADYPLLAKTIRDLAHLQIKGAEDLDFTQCINPIRFDRQAVLFDLNYFKYCFLKTSDLPFDEVLLEADLQRFATNLSVNEDEEHFFLYRDFQSRNVMLASNGEPFFIDFQGGMQGPLQYDVSSFLWQASAQYPQELRSYLIEEYIDELYKLLPSFNEKKFRERLQLFVLFRLLQVLGAYGLRGNFERKKYFLNSIPLAIKNLRNILNEDIAVSYPYLNEILLRLVNLPQFQDKIAPHSDMSKSAAYDNKDGRLVVRVFSFSFKKGIPEDTSGNGGGYVFDCRATHNPGRYERYKSLTGLDKPVISFLEEDGEIISFLDPIYKLADTHVKRYIERGFTSLMFSFGCTGGQHRSVYAAQHLAEHINQKFGIEVLIFHREQGIKQRLPVR